MNTLRILSATVVLVTLSGLAISQGRGQGGPGGPGGPGGFGAGRGGQKLDPSQMRDLPEILRRMLLLNNKQRYSGQRFVEFKAGPERRQHIEIVMRDGDRSRTEFPGDSRFAGQVIVEKGKQRLHYFPDRNEIEVHPAGKDELLGRLIGLLRKTESREIRIQVKPGGVIAGYPTSLVEIIDDRGAILQKLWIESRNATLMQRELFDRVGTVVGRSGFTKINFNPRFDPSDFEIRRPGATTVTALQLAKRIIKQRGFADVTLPEGDGFELHLSRLMEVDGASVFIQGYQFRGKNVSLFQVKGKFDSSRMMRFRGPETSIRTWNDQGINFALIGDMSPEDLAKIERRIRG